MTSLAVRFTASTGLALALLLAGASCSWSRFSDVQNKAPNVLLKHPKKLKAGFGYGVAATSLVVAEGGKQSLQVRLLGTGSPGHWGGAVYNLGSSDQPDLDALNSDYCAKGYCKLARAPVGMPIAGSVQAPLQLCFVSGLVQKNAAQKYVAGLAIGCDGGYDYSLGAPPKVTTNVIDRAFDTNLGLDPPSLVLGADHADSPVLVAGVRQPYGNTVERFAWFYLPAGTGTSAPPKSYAAQDEQLLTPPGSSVDEGYASAVAAVRLHDDTRILAVGAPGPEGHVWLFRLDKGATSAKPVGCLGGASGFGRTLASGRVDADQDEDLVVADDRNVSVFSGKALGQLATTTSSQCSLASLPAGALLASFGCGQTSSVSGCSKSGFGDSLAVGDLDGNGDGEVIVGAPRMTVRGTSDAGAVLVYDVSQDKPDALTEVDFISSAEDGDRMGTSVTAVRVAGNRDVVAAGAPGHQKVAVFYCSKLLPKDKRGARCK